MKPTNKYFNSVVTIAGVKGAYSLQAAINDIYNGSLHAIIDGNSRPFDDTRAVLSKGVTKGGEYASNNQGVVLSALITAQKFSRDYYEALHLDTVKNNFTKKLSADDKKIALDYANGISEKFGEALTQGFESLTAARKLASDKTKATKQANETEAAETSKKAEAAEAEAQKLKSADTLTISEFLTQVKKGDKKALAMAQVIAAALEAYNTSKANTQHAKNARKAAQALAA
jgi:hypothetical protein